MAVPIAQELIALLEPLAQKHGLELVTVECVGGSRHRIVRVYLDCDGGIDIDHIAAANQWVSDELDGVSRLNGSYTLEVSSPGIERPLRTRGDFERFAGKHAVVHTVRPLDGRSRFSGELAGLQGDDVVMSVDGQEHRMPFDAIERARLKADFSDAGERDR
ncbi:MAG: ribosome maturation factor RimP [Coriobacteriia bacterium]|nr:ribosome maturation factor RimP [Coriobacteriia bacterium]